MTGSTEKAKPPKSSKSTNLNISVQIQFDPKFQSENASVQSQIEPKSQSEVVPRDT